MICHRMGFPPIGSMGLGKFSPASRMRVPWPPHKMTACTRDLLGFGMEKIFIFQILAVKHIYETDHAPQKIHAHGQYGMPQQFLPFPVFDENNEVAIPKAELLLDVRIFFAPPMEIGIESVQVRIFLAQIFPQIKFRLVMIDNGAAPAWVNSPCLDEIRKLPG